MRATTIYRRLAGALLLCLIGISAASATTGGNQQFLWVHEDGTPGLTYTYGNGAVRRVFVNGVAQTGQYEVLFGDTDVLMPSQVQVVAYGTSNTRCKLSRATQPAEGFSAVPAHALVRCHAPNGTLRNSSFVISYSGWRCPSFGCLSGRIAPSGDGAFFTTADLGTRVANVIGIDSRGRLFESNVPNAFNTEGRELPIIEHPAVGHYRVRVPRLGFDPTGVVQITAIGTDAVHCKPSGGYNKRNFELTFSVYCYNRGVRADSDFVFNYDTYATRVSTEHVGARAYMGFPTTTGPYTPSRSWNSGAIIGGSLGSNSAGRYARGWYFVRHTQISPIHSSVFVVATEDTPTYCKVEWWGLVVNTTEPTEVRTRCFDADGNAADSGYYETYQGMHKGPM